MAKPSKEAMAWYRKEGERILAAGGNILDVLKLKGTYKEPAAAAKPKPRPKRGPGTGIPGGIRGARTVSGDRRVQPRRKTAPTGRRQVKRTRPRLAKAPVRQTGRQRLAKAPRQRRTTRMGARYRARRTR